MKYYLISIALHILIFMIFMLSPFTKNETKTKKIDNIIEVNLENSLLQPIETGEVEEKNDKISSKIETIKENEVEVSKSVREIVNSTIKSINYSKTKNDKIEISQVKNGESENVVGQTGLGNATNGESHRIKSTSVQSNGAESRKNGNTGTVLRESDTTSYFCREGIDFTVSYNPNLSYPISAQRLGISGDIVVNVRLDINSNGTVSVVNITGGHPAFYSEVRNAAKKIKLSIKNPSVSNQCYIVKPFRFKK